MHHTAATANPRPSSRVATIFSLFAIPAAVLLAGLVVSKASYAAYSAPAASPTINWATGTVVLTDHDANVATFTATNLEPGSTGAKCIAVTSSGDTASIVKLYGTTPATTQNLASHLTVSLTQGTGGSFGSCTGFTPLASGADLYTDSLDSFGSRYPSYTNGLGTWAPTGTAAESRTFRIAFMVNADAPDSIRSGTAALGFTWEGRPS